MQEACTTQSQRQRYSKAAALSGLPLSGREAEAGKQGSSAYQSFLYLYKSSFAEETAGIRHISENLQPDPSEILNILLT